MYLRFYIDPETDEPHIYEHAVTEAEVREVLLSRGDDFRGRRDSRIRFGRTNAGRFLKVIYKRDIESDSLFIITAYEIRGKALKAFRRRRRRRGR